MKRIIVEVFIFKVDGSKGIISQNNVKKSWHKQESVEVRRF